MRYADRLWRIVSATDALLDPAFPVPSSLLIEIAQQRCPQLGDRLALAHTAGGHGFNVPAIAYLVTSYRLGAHVTIMVLDRARASTDSVTFCYRGKHRAILPFV